MLSVNVARGFVAAIASVARHLRPTNAIITKWGTNVMDEKKYRCERFVCKSGYCYCSMNAGCVPNDDMTDCKRIGCPIRLNTPIS